LNSSKNSAITAWSDEFAITPIMPALLFERVEGQI